MAVKKTTTKPAAVKKAAKPKPLAPLGERVGSDPSLLARALKDPGLRSQLPDKYLGKDQQAVRFGNKLAVDGGTLTNRDVSTQAQQAADLQFGPNAVANQQSQNRQVADWYRAYQADLAQHQKNTVAAGNMAVGQIAGLQQGIAGLGRADQADQQAHAAQIDAVTGGQVADASTRDSQAAAVRQALLSAAGSQQAGVNAANAGYASNLANVVAPGQGLQAFIQGQQATQDLQAKINALKASTSSQLVAGERQSVAEAAANQAKLQQALQIAGLNSQTDLAEAKLSADTSRANAKTTATTSRSNARLSSSTSRANSITSANTTRRGQDMSSADHAADRSSRESIAAAKAAGKSGKKTPWATPLQQGSAKDSIGAAVNTVRQIRASNPKLTRAQIAQVLIAGQGASKDSAGVPKTKQTEASIALDIVLDGHISKRNAAELHRRRIKVAPLGYPTKAKVKAKPKGGLGGGLGGSVSGSAGRG